MSEQPLSTLEKKSKTNAGAAGIGGGTLLLVFANTLPENSKIKPWLIWIAPSVSVSLSAIWIWLQVSVANYVRDREVRTILNKAKADLVKALNNSNTSAEHRARIMNKLENLELVEVDRHMQKIKSLKFITSDDLIRRGKDKV